MRQDTFVQTNMTTKGGHYPSEPPQSLVLAKVGSDSGIDGLIVTIIA